jgi:hypothetical protein
VLYPGDLSSASDVHAIEERESLTLKFSRLDATGAVRAFAAQIRAGRVLTVVWSDGSFDEWRVGPDVSGRGEGGLITVEGVPLWLDLVERADSALGMGWVSDVSGRVRNFDYEITERTASSIFSAYVIPNCPSYVTLGTVDPTYVLPSLSVSRLTPGGLALAVRDALRSVDISCEVQLRRNGTTDYKLDLVTQIGASGNTPVFHPSTSLKTLTRKSDPTLQATRVLVRGGGDPAGLPGVWGVSRWRVGAPSGTTIALTDRNGGASPIAFDNQFVGQYLLRVKTGRTFPITASSAAAGTVTLGGGVSTIAADEDVEFRLTEPSTNTRTTTTRYAISAVGGGTITMGVSVPIAVDSQYVDWYARVWSASSGGTIVLTTRISASVAATDVITVASIAGVTTAHFVEFIQLDGAGEVPSFVDHPTYVQADPIGYGVKAMELAKPQAGIAQLIPNAWMRTWTTPASPPDGWSAVLTSGGPASIARNSSAAFTRYGGYSWQFAVLGSAGVAAYKIITPTAYPNTGSLSARAWVYFSAFADPGSLARFSVYALTAAGALGASLGSVLVSPLTGTGAETAVDIGTWVELKVENISLDGTDAPYGVVGVFEPHFGAVNSGANSPAGYLDVVEMFPFAKCPTAAMEFGDANGLLQAANNQLRLVASPPLFYTFGILDLARAFSTEYSRLAPTLGANARAADIEYGNDVTVRVLAFARDLLDATNTTLTLANRPTLLTSLESGGLESVGLVPVGSTTVELTQSVPIEAAYVELTAAAATLPSSTEIRTSSLSPTKISLNLNSAVTFAPADPTTAPSTSVAVGVPPSRAAVISRIPTTAVRASESTSSLFGYDSASDRTLPLKELDRVIPVINVRDSEHGARGDDLADDTGAFVSAVARRATRGLRVFIPPGRYRLDWTSLSTLTSPLIFEGAGPDSVLLFKPAGTSALFKGAASVASAFLAFRNLSLDGYRASQGSGVKDLVQFSDAPLLFEDVDFMSFTGRAIYGTNIPFFRARGFTVTDVAETSDALLAGGAALAYLPSLTGSVDIGDGRFIQGVPAIPSRAPSGLGLQGTSVQTLSGTIENLYFERYGHKSAGANPLGCIDVYNYGNDLTIAGIVGRNITHSLVKLANGGRVHVEATVVGQDHNFGAAAVQIGAGVHSVTGDFPDPTVHVKGTGFTAGPLVQVVGASGSEIRNPRLTVIARGCLQAISTDYIDGGHFDVVASDSTGVSNADSPIAFGTGCKGKVSIRANIKNSAVGAIYANASPTLDIHLLPGSVLDTSAVGGQHLYASGVRDVTLDSVQLLGTPTNGIAVLSSNRFQARGCQAPAGTTISRTSTTTIVESDNTWLVGSASWNPPNLAAGAVQSTTVPLLDCLVGDFVDVTFSIPLLGTRIWGEVLVAGTVTVYQQNPTGGAVDVGAGFVTARVRRG